MNCFVSFPDGEAHWPLSRHRVQERARLFALMLLAALSTVAQAQLPTPAVHASCKPGGKYVDDDFSPKPAFPEQTRAPRSTASSGFRVESVVAGIEFGRSVAALPDGRLLLAERGGRIRLVGRDGRAGAALTGTPQFPDSSALIGLQDIAIDPAFSRNGLVYLAYVTPKAAPADKPNPSAGFGKPPDGIGHIARARLSRSGDRLEHLKEIYQGSRVRRLVPAPDGTIYFSTVTGEDGNSQSLANDAGKVMRIRADGGRPGDNPFASRGDVGRLAFDLGHRDVDGLALDRSGLLWSVEHGPRGGDELNVIRAGRNYGFPLIGYGREYSGAAINNGMTEMQGMEQPVYFWTPDIAPSGLMIYSGKMFPQWRGDVFLGALVAQSVIRLAMTGERVRSEEHLLAERCERIRDVREATDGSIFVLTDGASGTLLRLTSG